MFKRFIQNNFIYYFRDAVLSIVKDSVTRGGKIRQILKTELIRAKPTVQSK